MLGKVPFKGYVTTERAVTGKSKTVLEDALGFERGALSNGYTVYALDQPIGADDFDWRDKTRYSAGMRADRSIKFGTDPDVVWLVRRMDELRAALGKQHNYDETATDSAIKQLLLKQLAKLNVRWGSGRIVKVVSKKQINAFPDSLQHPDVPQWELKVTKDFVQIADVS